MADDAAWQAVRDELAIRNVLARLAQLSDSGSLDEYARLFTEDAVWEMAGAPVRRGRAEIGSAGAERRDQGVTGPGSATMHLVGTIAVSVRGDDATAHSRWQFLEKTTTAPAVRAVGHYHDTLRRTKEGWKVARREIGHG